MIFNTDRSMRRILNELKIHLHKICHTKITGMGWGKSSVVLYTVFTFMKAKSESQKELNNVQ
jgi:hypothetical protein